MPKGFNRVGACPEIKIFIFKSIKDDLFAFDWGGYDKFNIPVWKYLDKHGNTIVRGLSPRNTYSFMHIFLKNELANINCLEITQKDIEGID